MNNPPSVRSLVAGVFRVTFVLAVLTLAGVLIDVLSNVRIAQQFGFTILGFVSVCAGVLVEVIATRALWKLGLGTPHPHDPPRKLVTKGPYRFSRNPLYVARILILEGVASLLHSPGVAVIGLALFVGLHAFLVPREERRLAVRHGQDYVAYRNKVSRWITLPVRRPRNRWARRPGG